MPKKSPEEEKYHRQLVEDNRKRYIKFLKEKQEYERMAKEKEEKRKENTKKLIELWENDLFPNWFKKKKDYYLLKKIFKQGIPPNMRGKVWLLCVGNNFSITKDYYEIEVKKSM